MNPRGMLHLLWALEYVLHHPRFWPPIGLSVTRGVLGLFLRLSLLLTLTATVCPLQKNFRCHSFRLPVSWK